MAALFLCQPALRLYAYPIPAASLIKWMEVAENCCNSRAMDDTCCMFGSIVSDFGLTLNASVAFTLTLGKTYIIT